MMFKTMDNIKDTKYMKAILAVSLTTLGLFFVQHFQVSQLTATLGITQYAAKKVIDIIAAAGSVWAIVGIVLAVIGSGGIGVGILARAKWLVTNYGKAYALAW